MPKGEDRLFSWAELILANRAERAFKIIREILERSSWFDTCFRYTYFWVVFPSANVTNILLHIRSFIFFVNKFVIFAFRTGKISINELKNKIKHGKK